MNYEKKIKVMSLRYIKHCLKQFIKMVIYHGTSRYCPVCKKQSRKFLQSGLIPRADAKCPFCGSLERHRLVWLYFKRKTDLFDGRPKQVLHVAPEPVFENQLKKLLGNKYLTADLYDPTAMVKMDITDIRYPDNTFDVIYCSHVLEHVVDDLRAMREFYRVLKPGGWAILLVPITTKKTFEDPTVTDPKERLKLFGQEDHLRRYGIDYLERLKNAGFTVNIIKASDFMQDKEIVSMGITEAAGEIYYCTK